MKNQEKQWEILGKVRHSKTSTEAQSEIVNTLLRNRNLETKKERDEFLYPTNPIRLDVKKLGINQKSLVAALKRIEEAIKKNERIIVYGDYDADGICATAILWECIYGLTKNVTPYLPDRFSEGYGLNSEVVSKLKSEDENLNLIITVDNGIVANEAVETANSLGIDVIISDHHQVSKKLPKAYTIIHTEKLSGSGIAWIIAREIKKRSQTLKLKAQKSLELAAIGTIADQLPLVGPNRSIVKYGLEDIRVSRRRGLLALLEEAGIKKDGAGFEVGTYEINYLVAPRLNAMGRIKHAMDSLRLLCTTNVSKARELALELGKVNKDRQQIVEKVVLHARELALQKEWKSVIVLADDSYHEGVIGLAAGKIVEEFYRPAIVVSKGLDISKASARSISGFNIIENLRKMESFIVGGGGHPMAAGFSIETKKIELFIQEFDKLTEPLLTSEILQKKLKIDCEISFGEINISLYKELIKFEPTGIGNNSPSFMTKDVNVSDIRTVGSDGKHLKLKLEKDHSRFDAIAFSLGYMLPAIVKSKKIDVVYSIDENVWRGEKSLQLKVKDIHF